MTSVFFSMTATFRIHGEHARVETMELTGVSPDDVMSQWGGVLNYLKREDYTVSSTCSRIKPMSDEAPR